MNKEQKKQLDREVEFANMGRQVLKNQAFNEAFTVRSAQIFTDFCKSKEDETEIRDEAWRSMQNLNAIEDYFRQLLETGKMAESSLKSLTE